MFYSWMIAAAFGLANKKNDRAIELMTDTTALLHQCYEGDDDAWDDLLRRHQDWILSRVRARLGPKLRRKLESMDVLQETILAVLRDTPRFTPKNGAQFRALMVRLIENTLCDKAGWFAAKKRDMELESPPWESANVDLSKPDCGEESNLSVDKAEMQARIRFVLELLRPSDRQIIVLREWDELSFAECGRALSTTADGARMRFNRALDLLKLGLRNIRMGEFDTWLDEADGERDAKTATTK